MRVFKIKSFQIGTINKVPTPRFGDFRTPPPILHAFKQYNDATKTLDVCFCLDPLPLPWSICTLWMVPW